MKKVLIATAIMAAFGAVITPLGVHMSTDRLGPGFSVPVFIAFMLALPGMFGLSLLSPVVPYPEVTQTAALAMGGAFAYGALALISAGMAWCIRAPFQKARKKRDSGEPSETQP